MEIAVLDDASDSETARLIVERVGAGRVDCIRHATHLGISGNWNACVGRARGHWVHILHQDDLLRPGFYHRLSEGITACPSVGAAFCRDMVVDSEGRGRRTQRLLRDTPGMLDTWIDHVFLALRLRASALVVKRSVYETLGGFREDLHYALDWDMWKRIAAAYPLWYEPAMLACYRWHRASATGGFVRSGRNIAEIGRSITLSEKLLPTAIASDVSRRARLNYTSYAVLNAWRALLDRDVSAACAQLREARNLTSTLATLRAIGRILPRGIRLGANLSS
jgi:GT2 family glycosyltransferase